MLLILAASLRAQTDPLTIAAASDLQFAMVELTSAFESQSGKKVRLVLGASGNLAAQIQNGAPYDLFMSADMDYPAKLASAGFADRQSIVQYGVGRLALWAPRTSKIDPTRGLEVLLEPSVRKIAVANPAHAPYGRLAMRALRDASLYDKLADRLVFGENVSQAAQFAASGNAQLALISLSLAMAGNMQQQGKFWEVPGYEIKQGMAVTQRGRANPATAAFLEFLKSKQGQAILLRHGFLPPGGQ